MTLPQEGTVFFWPRQGSVPYREKRRQPFSELTHAHARLRPRMDLCLRFRTTSTSASRELATLRLRKHMGSTEPAVHLHTLDMFALMAPAGYLHRRTWKGGRLTIAA